MGRHLLALLLVIPLFALSQEMTVIDKDCRWITGEREVLPTWVHEKQGDGRYIGISDPCLDSINGENQALLRAWFFAMLDDDISIRIMLESYDQIDRIAEDEHFAYNYSHLLKFSSNGSAKSFRRGRSHTTHFGERIVEYIEVGAFSAGGGQKYSVLPLGEVSIEGEHIASGREVSVVSGRVSSKLRLSALCNGSMVESTFELKGGLESLKIAGSINGVEIPYSERGRFWYDNSALEGYTQSTLINQTLFDGLWAAEYQSLIQSIVDNPTYDYLIKRVNDTYNDTVRTITRSLYDGRKSISMANNALVDDRFYVIWEMK